MVLSQIARCSIICCCMCINSRYSFTVHNVLPTPPFSELHDTKITEQQSSHFSTKNIPDIRASIQQLYISTIPKRPYLEELTTQLFLQLLNSSDDEVLLSTLFSMSACHHPLPKTICHALIHSYSPIIQLAAIQNVSDTNDHLLIEALQSNFPIVRLEAAWKLAHNHSKNAFFHIDALYHKLPSDFIPSIPFLYALEGSAASIAQLRHMIYSENEDVLVSTLHAIGQHTILELIPDLFLIISRSPRVLETLAYALRISDTEKSRDTLSLLTKHENYCVRLQATLSLTILDKKAPQIEFSGPFAFSSHVHSQDIPLPAPPKKTGTQLLNYAIAALHQRNDICLSELKKILTTHSDYLIVPYWSPGHTLCYWNIVSKDSLPSFQVAFYQEQSLAIKESLLSMAAELEEESFLDLASYIFEKESIELYPLLVQLLENIRSEKALEILEQESIRVAQPYNRAFTTLAQIRLKKLPEDSLSDVLYFCREKKDQSWRFPLPFSISEKPQKQSAAYTQLYIQCLETLTQIAPEKATPILIKELEEAPLKLLPFIASSLLHATL